jgi:hypothetical protein
VFRLTNPASRHVKNWQNPIYNFLFRHGGRFPHRPPPMADTLPASRPPRFPATDNPWRATNVDTACGHG